MDTMQIQVSSVEEAIQTARDIFAENPGVNWVVAEGAATVGGVTFAASGTLLMHRSERCTWVNGQALDDAMARVIET